MYPFVVALVGRRMSPGSTVLELGCGAMQYASQLPGHYLGLDLPGSSHVRERPHLVGSAAEIGLDSGTVDVIFGVAAFYLMTPIETVLAECHRVLRPGGSLLVFDYQRHVLEQLGTRPGEHVANIWNARDLRTRLVAVGFARRRVRDLSHRVRGTESARSLAIPPRYLKDRLGRHGQWLVVEAKR